MSPSATAPETTTAEATIAEATTAEATTAEATTAEATTAEATTAEATTAEATTAEATTAEATTAEESTSEITVLTKLPNGLVKCFTESSTVLELQYEKHTWLRKLDCSDETELLELQAEFHKDSYSFMGTLIEFLHVRKWYEFLLEMCGGNSKYGPVLLTLLAEAPRDWAHSSGAYVEPKGGLFVEELKASYGNRPDLNEFFRTLELRYDEETPSANDR
jgi:hypothetical protein